MYNSKLQKELQIDSRPSDAIAIALRADVPIFVSSAVLAVGSVSTDVEKDEQEHDRDCGDQIARKFDRLCRRADELE